MPHRSTFTWCLFLFTAVIFLSVRQNLHAQQNIPPVNDVCPVSQIQQRTPDFDAQGIILTYFDRYNIWVYDIARNTRYPLPETAPCGTNCHLSPDGRWFSFLDSKRRMFSKMRLNGADRTPLVSYATEVSWWDASTLLIWTPTQDAYLLPEQTGEVTVIETSGVVSVQPGGRWALHLEQSGDNFERILAPLDAGGDEPTGYRQIELGLERPYFSSAAWSPDGQWLAFTAPLMTDNLPITVTSEVFGIDPDSGQAVAWTDLTTAYGPVRINGHAPGELSWSPDGSKIAFWVIPLTGPDPANDTGEATMHILDVASGTVTRYCGFATHEHTPNPPRLIWSQDSNFLAFGSNLPNDTRGYVLLTLDARTGIFTELSAGLYPALGNADVIAWGLVP